MAYRLNNATIIFKYPGLAKYVTAKCQQPVYGNDDSAFMAQTLAVDEDGKSPV